TLSLGLGISTLWAAGPCCKDRCKCIEPPEPPCPDCSDPCCKWRCPTLFGSDHAYCLIDQLCNGNCCERIKAAKKLGCQLHADFCRDPEVLVALVKALLCDTCWEVRATAAWAITHQKGRTEGAVLALYLSSKIDPHYMVRDASADALDVLLVCRREC